MIGKLLLLGTGGIVAAGGAVDVWAKNTAADKIAERVEAALGGQAQASADIDSFPFLVKLLSSGSAGDISVTVENVTAAQVDLAAVTLELEGVVLDRNKLLTDRQAEITEIDAGTVTVDLDAAAITTALGGRVPVTIRDGQVDATVGGRTVTAQVTMASPGSVRVTVPGVASATIAIPQSALVACPVGKAEVDDDVVRVSCTVQEIPPVLLEAAQRAARR